MCFAIRDIWSLFLELKILLWNVLDTIHRVSSNIQTLINFRWITETRYEKSRHAQFHFNERAFGVG